MAERPKNYAWEALAEVTGTDWNTGRGELNAALKLIRDETEEQDSEALADLIYKRAEMYRELMPDAMLTPTALAKHWKRVLEETSRKRPSERAPNQASHVECQTCGGDRFVLVGYRPTVQSQWAKEHKLDVPQGSRSEEYACCYICLNVDVSFWRADGTRFIGMDPARAREVRSGSGIGA